MAMMVKQQSGEKETHYYKIGVFLGDLNTYSDLIWAGIAAQAESEGVNTVSFLGRGLTHDLEDKSTNNIIYQLANPENLDGLIVLTAGIGSQYSEEEITEFCDRFAFMPVLSVGERVPGHPNLLTDNQNGLRDLIRHLIRQHGRREIAFIRGPQNNAEAQARYAIYQETLVEAGLDFDEQRVVQGDFTHEAGYAAAEILIQRSVPFDAVVSVDDESAWGALDALIAQGWRIPQDVTVTGFDDIVDSQYSTPPLSTVRQPCFELGQQAFKLLWALIQGQEIPPETVLPTEMVVRQSCGCLSPAIASIQHQSIAKTEILDFQIALANLAENREQIANEISSALAQHPAADRWLEEQARQLLSAIFIELMKPEPGEFINSLEQVISQAITLERDLDPLQDLLTIFRERILAYALCSELLLRIETLTQQGRVLLGNAAQQMQMRARLRADQLTRMLFEINEDVITSFDLLKLMSALPGALRQLGISFCFLCLNDDLVGYSGLAELPTHSNLVFAYLDGEKIKLEPGGVRFETKHLIPDGILPPGGRCDMLLAPLHFQQYYLGYAIFEMGSRDGFIYDALQIQISSAVQGASLIQQLNLIQSDLECRVEERTADLQNEISERTQTEAVLRKNEQRYRALFEQTTDAVFIVSLEGIHLAVNQRAAEMLGYSVAEMIGMPASQVIAPHEFDNAMDKLAMIRQGQTVPVYERNLVRKDGSIVPVEINITLVSDDAGTPIHIQSVIREITKRKRAERIWQTLNMATLAMRSALTPEAIFEAIGTEFKSLGFECTVFRTNADLSEMYPRYFSYDQKVISTASKLLKIEPEKFLIKIADVDIFQKTIWEQETLFVSEASEATSQLLPKKLRKFASQLIRLMRVPRSINAPLIVDDQVMGMLSVQSNDLTEEDTPTITAFAHQIAAAWQKARLMQDLKLSLVEQLSVEESLRENEEKFRILFELSPEAIVVIGLNGIILDVNQAASEFGGTRKEEIIGKSFLEIDYFDEDQTNHYLELFSQSISGVLSGPIEVVIKVRNGEEHWVEIHPAFLKKGDDILALQLIIHDVTDQKMAEQAVQERVNELEAIYQTSIQLANASLQADEIGRIAVQQLNSIMNADECSFSILDEQERKLTVFADMRIKNGIQEFLKQEDIIFLDDYPAREYVLKTMTPMIVQASDPEADPAEFAYMKENGTATLAIIPLVIKNRAIGTLKLETWEERIYRSSQLNLAMTLANQIAVALENARLFEAAQQELFDRMQAEIALQESEERFRSIFENAVMGLYRTTPKGKIILANPALVRMLGYESFEELAERDLGISGFTNTSPRTKFSKLIERDSVVMGLESTWVRKDGSLLHVQESAQAIYDGNGSLNYYEGTVEDITQRKQVEALQRITEERFNRAFNISPLAMGIQGIEGDQRWVWLLVNDAFCEITGYSRVEIILDTNQVLQLYANIDQREQAFNLFSEEGNVKEFEFAFRKKSGEIRAGLLWLERLEVGDEKNTLVLIQDITERKQIEKERQALIEFQQIVAELSTRFINLETAEIELEIERALQIIAEYAEADACSVWMFDAAQSTASKTFGWPTNQKDGDNQAVPIHRFSWFFSKLLNNETVVISGKQDTPPAAEDLYLFLNHYNLTAILAVPLVREGYIIGTLSIFMQEAEKIWADDLEPSLKILGDIIINALERKRAEESIYRLNEELEMRVVQRTQQLEAANRELEAFAYSVSHDLRAPLRALDGFSLALIEDYADQLDENAKNYLHRVRAASQRMGQLIDDLLKLSRITRSEMLYQPVNLSELVLEIIAELQESEPKRVIEFDIQPDLIVLGDEHLLQIALANLLSNAWKFSSKEPQAQISFGRSDEEKHPVFFVRDNGAGFEMAYVNKLFGTFQRLHSPQDFEGTGIGLATVKRIILRHGGCVWAKSQVGHGATFYFTIGEVPKT